MNDLRKTTITTLEVAEMMEVPHNDILRKLDGRKDRKGYIQIMTESQMAGVIISFLPHIVTPAEKRTSVTRSQSLAATFWQTNPPEKKV